jgi:hypothetical protein
MKYLFYIVLAIVGLIILDYALALILGILALGYLLLLGIWDTFCEFMQKNFFNNKNKTK